MAAASTDLTPVFQAAGAEWNVDPNLLQAVAGQESGGTANPDQAQSSAGAQGRMQIMPATGWQMGMTDPSDPVQSIYAGARYLSQQLDKYGSPELALAAYNAGPGRVDDYLSGKAGLPVETVNYVPSIARRYQALAGGQQQSNQAPAATPAGPSLDDTATAGLNAAMARLQSGGGSQASPAPVASPSAASTAAPAASGPASSIAAMSPSDFFAATAGTSPAPAPTSSGTAASSATTTTPAVAPAGSVAGQIASMSPSDFFAATAGVKPPPSGANANTGPEYSSVPTVNDLVGGAVHGFHSVVDALNRGAAYVDSKVPFLAKVDAAAGENPAADVAAQPAAEAAYQQKYGNSTAAAVGNFVGQTAAAAPILATGGALVGGVGGALAEGVGGAATGIGRGVQAGVDMLTGTASAPGAGTAGNVLARGTSLVVNGGVQGAGFNALTGGDPVTGAEAGMALGPIPAAGGLLLKGVKQVGSAGAGVFNKLTGSTAALDADINAAVARSKGAGDNALNPGGVPAATGQATPTAPAVAPPAPQNALTAGVTAPPATSPVTAASAASTAAAPAGWRLVQPGEPVSVGQQVATDAQGQQWTSAPAASTPTPSQTVATAPVAPVTATALPPPTGSASVPAGVSAAPETTAASSPTAAPASPASLPPPMPMVPPTPASAGAAATSANNLAANAMTPAQAAASRATGFADRLSSQAPLRFDNIEYVPGSRPTLAEQTASPELAAQQRVIAPGNAEFTNLDRSNNEARLAHFDQIAGSPTTLETLQAQRSAQADTDLQAAWANKKPADAQPVVDQINAALAGPDGKLAPVRSALEDAMSALQKSDGSGLETDPEMLYGARKQISYLMSKTGQRANPAYGEPTVVRQLQGVKDALDSVIEPSAPGYQNYLDNYSAASRPIDAQEYLQSKRAGLLGVDGTMQLSRVHSLMKGIGDQMALPGPNAAKSISDDDVDKLFNLRADLLRQNNRNLQRAAGSDTQANQTVAAEMGMNALTAGAHVIASHVPGGNLLVGPAFNSALKSSNAKIKTRLTNRLLGAEPMEPLNANPNAP